MGVVEIVEDEVDAYGNENIVAKKLDDILKVLRYILNVEPSRVRRQTSPSVNSSSGEGRGVSL